MVLVSCYPASIQQYGDINMYPRTATCKDPNTVLPKLLIQNNLKIPKDTLNATRENRSVQVTREMGIAKCSATNQTS